jgi:hypothetical protein
MGGADGALGLQTDSLIREGKLMTNKTEYMVWLAQGCPQPQTYNYSSVREAAATCGPGDCILAVDGEFVRELNSEERKQLLVPTCYDTD